jgi:hypothetical protein
MSGDLVVDYEPDVWLPLETADLDAWASDSAAQCWAEAGLPEGDPGIALLATQLLYFGEKLVDEPALVFFHLRHPELGPIAAVLVTSFDAGDGSDESLRELLGADDPALLEPATVERVDSQLGSAMRARRYLEGDPGNGKSAVFVTVGYAWHVPMVESDIRLTTASFELGELALIEEDIDALAQVVRVEP